MRERGEDFLSINVYLTQGKPEGVRRVIRTRIHAYDARD